MSTLFFDSFRCGRAERRARAAAAACQRRGVPSMREASGPRRPAVKHPAPAGHRARKPAMARFAPRAGAVLLSAVAEAAAPWRPPSRGGVSMDQVRDPARAYLELEGVRVWAPDRSELLRDVTWRVRPGEHWALLGPNGAGKTTLLSMAGARRHPSAGVVRVLGERLGKVDMRELRRLIGVVDPALRMPDELTAEAVVLTGATGSVQPLWERYGPPERARARELLELMGRAHRRGGLRLLRPGRRGAPSRRPLAGQHVRRRRRLPGGTATPCGRLIGPDDRQRRKVVARAPLRAREP